MQVTTQHYKGLRKHPDYEDMMEYLDKQPKIKYPERQSTFTRNSPQFQNMIEMLKNDTTEYQQRQLKNTILEDQYRRIAEETGHSVNLVRAQNRSRQSSFDVGGMSDKSSDTLDKILEAADERREAEKRKMERLRQQADEEFNELQIAMSPTGELVPTAPPFTPPKSPENKPTMSQQAMDRLRMTPGGRSASSSSSMGEVYLDGYVNTLDSDERQTYNRMHDQYQKLKVDSLKTEFKKRYGYSAPKGMKKVELVDYVTQIAHRNS